MNIKNFEFKAKIDDLGTYEEKLLKLNPTLQGKYQQIDTYFNVKIGRLKLREADNENVLINYIKENTADSKKSEVILYQHKPNKAIKDMLALEFGIKTVVDKIRKIYSIDNVKFHFDQVKNLGTFMEVEAIDQDNSFTYEKLKEQCDFYFNFFGLSKSDLIEKSYSDLIQE